MFVGAPTIPQELKFTAKQRTSLALLDIPDQLLDTQIGRGCGPLSAEKAMWAAVMVNALQEASGKVALESVDYKVGDGGVTKAEAIGRRRADAWRWIEDVEDHGFGSFYWICMVIDLDPDYMRQQIRKPEIMRRWARTRGRSRRMNQPISGARRGTTGNIIAA